MSEQKPSSNFTLVFDWGDTLMQVLPNAVGPMVNWPEVSSVPGVGEALAVLAECCPLVVATNAADSTVEQVRQALQRAGLAEYFRAIFTARELGAAKPALSFFRQLESVLGQPAHRLVMIGDGYSGDILGAKSAGWRAVWYNPHLQAAPGLIPLQDVEIQHMAALPAALQTIPLPDYPTCLSWLVARGTPFNILAHVQLVAAVAYQIAMWLRQGGVDLDPLLTHRGALLHDLAKIDSLRRPLGTEDVIDHAALAHRLLLERGLPDLAEIANRHMPYRDPNDARRPQTWEQKLVHYADKLSEGTQLVSIDERLQALKGRYPQAAAELEASWPLLSQLQDEICAALVCTPEELVQRLHQAIRHGSIVR